jgi:cysteine desulfurase family protein
MLETSSTAGYNPAMGTRPLVNLDNAATSGTRPEEVIRAVAGHLRDCSGNPGRSGHGLSLRAARVVFECREAVAKVLGVRKEDHVFFTRNATEALNLALFGTLGSGARVLVSSFEHNSVMRPLSALERRLGIRIERVAPGPGGRLFDPSDLEAKLGSRPELVVFTHASNVTGETAPVAEISAACRRHGVPLLVDGAQGTGSMPLELEAWGVDFFAFTGHKGMLGPQGIGGLYARDPDRLEPLVFGGTGSASESVEQPSVLPDRFESGTANGPGCAGLLAGARFLLETGLDKVRRRLEMLLALLLVRLSAVPGLRLLGDPYPSRNAGLVSFVVDGREPDDLCRLLDERHGILSRPGLHCAPSAHRALGTFPRGALRFSLSYFNTEQQVEAAGAALLEIVKSAPDGCGARTSPSGG